MTSSTYADGAVTVHHGDCIEVLATLPDASVDAVITDPPYLLGFMGRAWDSAPAHDHLEWHGRWIAEAVRVLKPGGHLAAFGGSRTWHRLACAVEDAGLEVRDSIAWLYASGFPKSLDVGAAVDRLDAAELRRERALTFTAWLRTTGITAAEIDAATGTVMGGHYLSSASQPAVATPAHLDALRPIVGEVPAHVEDLVAERVVDSANHAAREVIGQASGAIHSAFDGFRGPAAGTSRTFDVTAPHTEDARTWAGWGTALKPAFEPIVLARKPLAGTVAANVVAYGTGGLNIDAARVPMSPGDAARIDAMGGYGRPGWARADGTLGDVLDGTADGSLATIDAAAHPGGRWPTNVILDDHAAAALDGATAASASTSGVRALAGATIGNGETLGTFVSSHDATGGYDDAGGVSRYFPVFRYAAKAPTEERPRVDGVAHPTVKPLDLMRWLVRLLTPPGGVVLDPFAGSGTTAEACVREGARCITVEREAAYLPLIAARLTRPQQVGLDFDWTT